MTADADLTQNEQRHAAAIGEIEVSPHLESSCGDLDEFHDSLADLLPLYQYNEEWDDVIIDDEMLEKALRFMNLGAQWSTTSDLPEILGEYRVLHFYDVFDQLEGPEPFTTVNEYQKEFLSELRCFDVTALSGAGLMSFIRMKPDTSPLEIWYHEAAKIGTDPYPPGFIKMDITYGQYLDALLLTKGTYGWQYLYTDVSLDSSGDLRRKAGYLKNMLEVFPRIFPQHDYSALQERLEARL